MGPPKHDSSPPKEKGAKETPAAQKSKPPALSKPPADRTFLSEALATARRLDVDHLLFICDTTPPVEQLKHRALKKKVIVAATSEKVSAHCEEEGFRSEIIPAYAFDRFEKIKVALATCISSGLLVDGMRVMCLAGPVESADIDTAMYTLIGEKSEEKSALGVLHAGAEFSPQVLEAVLNIALSVGYEGFEGSPVGTIFAVGDSTAVMEKSKQLTLNPLQGYSEDERNILDPSVRDSIKNYCVLDGAFVIREDGVVLAAGRYLRAPDDQEIELPLGLGTRNAAAIGITQVSNAIAFVVSKTTGTVRIYKGGKLKVELKQPRRRL
jgi:DNA integrity scanning protein DisA with diadenylate cyclase activity